MTYRLTNKAEEDVIRIYLQSMVLFGARQAEAYHRELESVFGLIARNPEMARPQLEISPPVRVHPHKAHLIVYLIEDNRSVTIVRIRHGHEDWESDVE